MLWGIHPVVEGLAKEPETFSEIILQREKQGSKIQQIIEHARKHKIKLSYCHSIKISGESGTTVKHQGVVARRSSTPLVPFDRFLAALLAKCETKAKVRILVCDCIQDPHNLGAIIRSALASGAEGIIVTRERSAPVGGAAAKASAGALAHIDICQVTNLSTTLKKLKDSGFWVYGAVKDHSAQSLFQCQFADRACLVVGSEGKGIRPLVKKECDVLLSIPMKGELDSLNSSVAAGILLFEALRQEILG